ncbi:MAG: OmpH family outer membrane protein [Flavobacterium sp.]|nr:OmpH family outer membrane protein [Flavobacterium sp.]
MKKYLVLLLIVLSFTQQVAAQGRGVKIGYIDMEYILQNVPEYSEAKNLLEQKAQKWKQEIEVKRNAINKLKDGLKVERVLLTKELIEEREEEITLQETELMDYQQKRFGPNGDLIVQKAVLTQPVQDQVFNAVQDIAEAKKYDFIFDRTSELTMLFAAKRFDISDQVVRKLARSSKRNQLTKKQLKEEEAKEAKEDMVDESSNLSERQKKLDERKAAREKLVADRKAEAEAKRKEAAEKKKQAAEAKKAGVTPAVPSAPETANTAAPTTNKESGNSTAAPAANNAAGTNKGSETPAVSNSISTNASPETPTTSTKTKEELAAERKKVLEERRKALEEKKRKAIEEREAARKAKEANAKQN